MLTLALMVALMIKNRLEWQKVTCQSQTKLDFFVCIQSKQKIINICNISVSDIFSSLIGSISGKEL
jgi:hypothetical protein